MRSLLFASCIAVVAAAAPYARSAAEPEPKDERYVSMNDFGGVGLLQTRTARFGPDGLLDVGGSFVDEYFRYYVTLHALPWLEGTFRYTDIRNRLYSNVFSYSGSQSYKDKGADIKIRLVKERRLIPQIAVGLQDGLGTGQFQSEYLVASKRFLDLDLSFGIAWGYLAHGGSWRNPLIDVWGRFSDRTENRAGGGRPSLKSYFSGATVAPFFGVEYRTPVDGLTLKLEYEGNDYRNEPLGNAFEASTPLNFGFNYRPFPWFDVSLAYERGNSITSRLSLRHVLHDPGLPKFDPPPPAVRIRPRGIARIPPAEPSEGPEAATGPRSGQEPEPAASRHGETDSPIAESVDELFVSLERAGFDIQEIELTHGEARIVVENDLGGDVKGIAERVAGDVAAHLPVPIERVTFSSVGGEAGIDASRDRVTVHVASTTGPEPDTPVGAARATAGDRPGFGGIERDSAVESETGEVAATRSDTGPDVTSGREPLGTAQPPLSPLSRDDQARIATALFEELAKEEILGEALRITGRSAVVYTASGRFRQFARNAGRTLRVAANVLPDSIEELTVASLHKGIETNRVKIWRKDLENAANGLGSAEEVWGRAEVLPGRPDRPRDVIVNPDRYPRLFWGIGPAFRQHIGGPERFILYQVYARANAELDVLPGLTIGAAYGQNVYSQFGAIRQESDSVLPRVRSDIKEYLQRGESGIVRLQADYAFSPLREVYARLSAGLFEEMFGGVGGEVLYRPFTSRLALGAEWNWVRQRDFDASLKFRDYDTGTGHFSVYYQWPWYDILSIVNVGRYLARDDGATFNFSREFDSGVRMGAWFTLTNVSAEEFGEGSFDKGFFINIPFDLLLPRSTTSSGHIAYRPLTRDGGQMVHVSTRLYDRTGGANLNTVARDWDRFMD